MRAHLTLTDEDFVVAAAEEKKRRHDVMAHVHAFGQVGKYYGRVDTASFSILLDRTLISRNVLEPNVKLILFSLHSTCCRWYVVRDLFLPFQRA